MKERKREPQSKNTPSDPDGKMLLAAGARKPTGGGQMLLAERDAAGGRARPSSATRRMRANVTPQKGPGREEFHHAAELVAGSLVSDSFDFEL